MKIIDLSRPIQENMTIFPGTESPQLQLVSTCQKDGFQETILRFYSHTGTHVDAPAHVFPDGITLDHMPCAQFMGQGLVIPCAGLGTGGSITMSHLRKKEALCRQADFLLFATGWEFYWGTEDYFGNYPCIDEEVADFLLQTGKKGIGLDTFGVDPIADTSLYLHKKLLQNGNMIIVENLNNLSLLGEDCFSFYAFPLLYDRADGAPARVIAMMHADE